MGPFVTVLAFLTFPFGVHPVWSPVQIDYSKTPGFGQVRGQKILEWSIDQHIESSLLPNSGLRIKWLGTAGFELSDAETTLLIDPFVSRPTLGELASPVEIQTSSVDNMILKDIPLEKLKLILISHEHHDHAMDVPYILSQYQLASDRPMVVGSPNLDLFLRTYDHAEMEWLGDVDPLSWTPRFIVPIPFNDPRGRQPKLQATPIPIGHFGNFEVTAFITNHPHYDTVATELTDFFKHSAPHKGTEYGAFQNRDLSFLVTYKDRLKFFFSDSPEQLEIAELAKLTGHVDVLFQGIASRSTKNDIEELTAALQPRYFVPTHYDNFFRPIQSMQTFDVSIRLFFWDYSRFSAFLRDFKGERTQIRLLKLLYYYSLEEL